jgi:transposase InsO family protein
MIDPATGWFEIVETPNRRADEVANLLQMTWLTRYPWPTEVVMDRGNEFQAEVSAMLKNDYGITKKVITTRNPQANSMVERVHQVIHQLIRSFDIKGKADYDQLDYGWSGMMSAIREAVRSTVHTTQCATPTQLVFNRDAILNVAFEADWQYIKERKLHRIIQNNKKVNAKRIPHQYAVGDRVMAKQDPS